MTTLVLGCPYIAGDTLHFEGPDGHWHRGTVLERTEITGARFGLRWLLHVIPDDALGDTDTTQVLVDDNGRNHTYRRQVCPAPAEVA